MTESSQWETDAVVRSLAVCTHPSGVKSYVFRHRARGKVFKAAIGRVGTLALPDARAKAQVNVGRIALGFDPIAEEKAEAERNRAKIEAARRAKVEAEQEIAFTVGAMIKAWTASRGRDDKRSVNYVASIKAALETAFESVLDLPADNLSKVQIEKLVAAAESRGPAAAVRAQLAINLAFRRAIKIGKLTANPCATLEPRKVSERERVLAATEIKRIWRAAGTLPDPIGRYVRFLVATGTRRNEALFAQWSEIEGDLWRIPANRMKAKRDFTVPLTRAALSALPTRAAGFVFSRTDGRRSIGGVTRIKALLDAAIEADGDGPLVGWTFHDLRRSLATWLGDRGVDYVIADLCLAHSIPLSRTGKTYQRSYKITERREALDMWSAMLEPGLEPARRGRTLRIVK
jgi:integrase